MAPGWSWRELLRIDRRLPPPIEPPPDEAALAAALSRHELALARLRLELPSPSDTAFRELEAAERDLKSILARRDRQRP